MQNNEEVFTGKILEDRPGEYLLLEMEGETIKVIKYDDIEVVKIHNPKNNEGSFTFGQEILDKKNPLIDNQKDTANVNVSKLETSLTLKVSGYNGNILNGLFDDLSLYELSFMEVDKVKLNCTNLKIRQNVYNNCKKTDSLNITLLNIIPGLGSFVQGDYATAFYSIFSVAGAVIYNLNEGFGSDYYFAINLNGLFSYTLSFFAPVRYNKRYNKLLEERLSI